MLQATGEDHIWNVNEIEVNKPLLVSLHIPKTAGTTLRCILESRFGNAFQPAYDDPAEDRIVANPECLHGHAILEKFGETLTRDQPQKWITFLRDPLETAVSLFHYMRARQRFEPEHEFGAVDLEDFLTHRKRTQWPNPYGYTHNCYSAWFRKYGRRLEDFDFVGIAERFDESILLLHRQFGWTIRPYDQVNRGSYRRSAPPEEAAARFRELNSEDYALHRRASTMLDRRRAECGPSFASELESLRSMLPPA